MFEFRKTNRYFAQTQRRVEAIAREELEELGATECNEGYCGVHFHATIEQVFKINYCARTIMRVLAPLSSFHCPNDTVLYNHAMEMPWDTLFSLKQTFAVDANVSNSSINHSKFAALRLKDAIADYFRKVHNRRPNVDTQAPDIRLNLNIDENKAIISFDTSGESLHRRGYRIETVSAPMQETLAASIIRLSKWDGEKSLLDPMCGSGTLLAEALMKYCRIPAGYKRETFGFFNMLEFEKRSWLRIKFECDRSIRELPEGLISGSDIAKEAAYASRVNINELPGGNTIKILKQDFRKIDRASDCMIITNPPYGIRLQPGHNSQDEQSLFTLYKEMGDFLKQKCSGSTAFILCGEKDLSKHIGLKISQRIPLFNGPLDSRLVRIDLYSGSRD